MSQAWDHAFAPAKLAADVLGFSASAVSVIQMQFLQEKGDAYWDSYPQVSEYNFANSELVTETIASEGAGITLYCFTLLLANPQAYAAFVSAGRAGDAEAAAVALSESPWANPPYGASFVADWKAMVAQNAAPASAPATDPAQSAERYVTVTADTPGHNSQLGTLWGIAQANGLTIQQLLRLNPGLSVSSVIQPGQQIRIQ